MKFFSVNACSSKNSFRSERPPISVLEITLPVEDTQPFRNRKQAIQMQIINQFSQTDFVAIINLFMLGYLW
jgi:hypothetical protein